MTSVFADTFYWYALINRRDQWHGPVMEARGRLGNRTVFTTEEVLTEFLAAMSPDPFLRNAATKLVDAVFADPLITVVFQSHETFEAGLELYRNRTDKHYSLTDCISMNLCAANGITEILTNDHHFVQEGFTILINP